ncbi:MAG: hypothetical protein H6741_06405 [Alphaproteobacteria bacterium]|nr:hypothetical protein [Alphaproteobacteria bacterium]MCB9792342.1 hypothetical protein [Alphaproteobacteria bacterium]
MTPRIRLWLCRALVALGLSRGLLMLGGLELAQFGLIQLVASPLPLVFDRPLYFARFAVLLRHPDGHEEIVALDREAVGRLQGPMGRTQMLTHAMAWSRVMPPELRARMHCYLLARPGRFMRELGGQVGAQEVEVELIYEGPGEPFHERLVSTCGAP